MKIAFLAFTKQMAWFLSGLEQGMVKRGHQVKVFYQAGYDRRTAPNHHEHIDWLGFRLKKLEQFAPEKLVIFNGFAQQSFGATMYLRNKFKVAFVERGWFPQYRNIYIDNIGLGGRSSLAQVNMSRFQDDNNQTVVDNLIKDHYKVEPVDEHGSYILVPMQLEQDTSVVLDSPYFKSMNSLISFVSRNFEDKKIIVKTHPKEKKEFSFKCDNVEVVSDVSINDLAYSADAIVGINSTSMVEALVHYKPIAMLGKSICSSCEKVMMHHEESFKNIRDVLKFRPDKNYTNATIKKLLDTQFHLEHPPERAFDFLER